MTLNRVTDSPGWAARGGMSSNALINGNFDVWQRGTSVTNPATNAFIADRFQIGYGADGATFPTLIHSRGTFTPGEVPQGFNYYGLNTSAAGSGFGAISNYAINQKIENGTRYLCGAGKKITISFYARSTIAGKRLGVFAIQNYGSGGAPTTQEKLIGQVITLTPSFAKYSVTITTNTLFGKTFGSNNDDVLRPIFQYMWGTGEASTNYSNGGGTLETFGGNGFTDIAQVQLCAGDVALPFAPRSFGEELALCQRYYERFEGSAALGRANLGTALALSATAFALPVTFKVEKRVVPTLVQGGTGFRFLPSGATTALTFSDGNRGGANLSCSATGATINQAALVQNTDAGGWVAFDAEL